MMQTSTLALSTAVSLALGALTLSACGDPVGPAPSSKAPVTIGVSMGFSGGLASTTQDLRAAVRMAEHHINASGGILGGRPVSFDIVDDNSNADVNTGSGVLLRVADGLVAKQTIGMLGPVGSGQVAALGDWIAANQRVVISPSATADSLTASGSFSGFFFRTAPPDSRQVKALVNILKNGPRGTFANSTTTCKRLGIFSTQGPYQQGLKDGLKAAWLAEGGGTTVSAFEPPSSETSGSNFATEVAFLKGKGVDCLAVLAYESGASAFLRTLATTEEAVFNGLQLRVGPEALYSTKFIQAANQNIGTASKPAGNFVGAVPAPDASRTAYNHWLSVLSGYDPATVAAGKSASFFASTYDAAILMALAAHQSKGAQGPALRDALRAVASGGDAYTPLTLPDAIRAISDGGNVNYDGASGDCDFDAKGDVVTGFQVWRVETDQLVITRAIKAGELQ